MFRAHDNVDNFNFSEPREVTVVTTNMSSSIHLHQTVSLSVRRGLSEKLEHWGYAPLC